MDFEKFIKNLPFRFFFFPPASSFVNLPNVQMQERIHPAGGASRSGDDLGGFARQEALLQGILHSITAWLNRNFIVMRFAMLDREGAAGLLISQIRGPGSQVDLCEW